MAQEKKTQNKDRKKTGNTKKKKNTTSYEEKNKYKLTEQEMKIRGEVKLLLALGLTILLFISNFGLLPPIGNYISYFMFGLTGIAAYILPVLIFFGTAFLISNRRNKRAYLKFWAALALFFFLLALIHMVFPGYSEDRNCFYYYFYCGENKVGGGFFAALLVNALCGTVGIVGAYILLIILIIISAVLITERSFIGGVKKGSRKVYQTAREDVSRIRESGRERAKEKEYQKNRRIHKVVRGVALSKIEDPDKSPESMHEINADNFEEKEIQPEEISKIIPMPEERTQEPVYGEFHVSQPKVSFVKRVEDIPVEDAPFRKEKPVQEKVYIDEEGNYHAKEQIIVSESAKKVMERPAFGMSPGQSKLGPDGAVEIAKANVENSVYEPQKADRPVWKGTKRYILPTTDLLNRNQENSKMNPRELQETARKLEQILKNFGVKAVVTEFHRGPSVTRYEIQPEIGTRLNKITTLADDIKLNLAATDIRIEPIPGKSTIGIEVPNKVRESVLIRELIESAELRKHQSKLAFAAGKDIAGQVIVADIAKMPHFLIAGTTGSGKSVFTNSIIMSILFRAKPDEVRLIIVDPKVVEFGIYNGIPHLLQPVVTDPKLASNTLKWAVAEMQQRYKKFAESNVRDLKGYNAKQEEKLPQIVIVIDELADLMMVAAKEVEESICRLAQLARAAGIHLIIATQRPSVDVVTGLIKANIPSRCALMVSSGVDSRTIIDSVGAEKLLGNGDMLFYPSGYVKPVRLQGAFVSDAEVQRVVDFWTAQGDGNNYDESISEYVASQPQETAAGTKVEESDGRDEYFTDAARLVTEKEKASTSMLQRVFKIGFNRAARIIEQLEEAGIIGAEEGTKPRKVLVSQIELEDLLNHLN